MDKDKHLDNNCPPAAHAKGTSCNLVMKYCFDKLIGLSIKVSDNGVVECQSSCWSMIIF